MNNFNLNELTLDNLGQWPLPVKRAVVFILMIVIFFLGYWFVVSSNFSQLKILNAQEKLLRSEYETKQIQSSTLEAYRKQLMVIQERFGTFLKELPSENEMPGLLEDISKTGIAAGLKLELFAPKPEVEQDFYIELPIKIKVTGSYSQLAIFISHIAQMNRLVTLHDFVIEKMDSDLTMEITATIYRYRPL